VGESVATVGVGGGVNVRVGEGASVGGMRVGVPAVEVAEAAARIGSCRIGSWPGGANWAGKIGMNRAATINSAPVPIASNP